MRSTRTKKGRKGRKSRRKSRKKVRKSRKKSKRKSKRKSRRKKKSKRKSRRKSKRKRKSRRKKRSKSKRKSRKKPTRTTGKTVVYLKKSNKKDKKWMVYIVNPKGGGKTIHFGARGMSDYTKHKDKKRMKRYSNRHNKKETWSKAGIKTAGFWSKNLLWNKPSFTGSKRDIATRFGITFRSGWPKK